MGNRERNREPGLTADNAIRFLPFGRPQAYVHTDIRSFTDYVGGAIDTVLDYEPDTDRSEFFLCLVRNRNKRTENIGKRIVSFQI